MASNATINKLIQHPLWTSLTGRQQKFTEEFAETHDPITSARAAYTCTTSKSAENQARQVLRNWKVRKILASFGGYEVDGSVLTRAELLQFVSDRIRKPDTDNATFLKLLATFKELGGAQPRKAKPAPRTVAMESPEPESAPPDIDAIVQQLEKERQSKS